MKLHRRSFFILDLICIFFLATVVLTACNDPVSESNATEGDSEITEVTDGDMDYAESEQHLCPSGFNYDDDAGRCVPAPRCPEGFSLDTVLGRCVPDSDMEDGDEDSYNEDDLDSEYEEQVEESEVEDEAEESDTTDTDQEIVIPPDTFTCESLGLVSREFEDVESSKDLYAKAADITIPTTVGDWNLKEKWTGCETYLFIQESPRQNNGWPSNLWDRDVDDLLDLLPDNAHVFFISSSPYPFGRTSDLNTIKNNVDEVIGELSEEEQARWFHRIHYVTVQDRKLPGWLGELMINPAWGVAIDRFQRIRYIGSYADYDRYDNSQGWFAPNLSMAANEAIYYNYEARRAEHMESFETEVVDLFDGEVLSDPGWAGQRGYVEVEFPDAETIDAFDTLELDLYLGCDGSGEFGTCPAWDYIVHLYLCDKEDTESCDTEFGRWITTYHREGRWLHDVSGLLPLLEGGGTRRFAFYTQQPYEVKLSLRFSNHAKAVRPSDAIYLFSGGSFGADYNDKYSPIVAAIDADAVKVELATVITGHGMANPGNCAEFCNTTHHFFVNGIENVIQFPEAGTSQNCMDMVDSGTVPNQYGTWWYGRSGWCPGREVQLEITDITDQVVPGEETAIEYMGLRLGEPYSGGADIRMTSWLVISK